MAWVVNRTKLNSKKGVLWDTLMDMERSTQPKPKQNPNPGDKERGQMAHLDGTGIEKLSHLPNLDGTGVEKLSHLPMILK